jgi:hypothetical protein
LSDSPQYWQADDDFDAELDEGNVLEAEKLETAAVVTRTQWLADGDSTGEKPERTTAVITNTPWLAGNVSETEKREARAVKNTLWLADGDLSLIHI